MAEKKFGGRTFQVGHVLATDAIRLQVRLLAVIGGGVDRLPVILAGVGPGATPEAKEKSNAASVAALTDMIGKADPDGVTVLIQNIAGFAQIKSPSGGWTTVDLDQDFTAHKADILPFLGWVLREVLGDFFGGLLAPGSLSKVLGTA